MKEFVGTFFACLVICYVATFFFAYLILENIWIIVTLIALFLSVLITIFIKQETRIEELEKRVEKLLNNKQD
ncbi:hypothetical protein [Aquisalibacillus elongatus]|uniref:Uncharacterized protein n=1 Tax=Aquisalibacillus elongatus TaxID=485577 RepID=A0A3N5BAC3_9BACI|nr:hypothetical protein [Aquisalibacillus elongatus]RPF54337.1 hypothetical protein EDC24_1534 [Aquisalibacillus elongatus]